MSELIRDRSDRCDKYIVNNDIDVNNKVYMVDNEMNEI